MFLKVSRKLVKSIFLLLTTEVQSLYFSIILGIGNIMPALDINLINQLGRDLHNVSPGYMGEDEVCPWTLFLTMALTLLKGGYS